MDIFTPNRRQAEINAHTRWLLKNDPTASAIGVRIITRSAS